MEVRNRKFADVPKASKMVLQLFLLLPTSYVFCLLSQQRLPSTPLEFASDVGVLLLTLLVFIPILAIVMVSLRFVFYRSFMGTELKVSSRTKKAITILFIVIAVPTASCVQADLFLRISGRATAPDLLGLIANGILLLISGAPGLIISILDARAKIKLVEDARKEASKLSPGGSV